MSTHLIKNILELKLRQSRTFHILNRSQLLSHPLAVLLPHGRHLLLRKLLPHLRVIAQIGLRADDQTGNTGAVVVHLGEPFFTHVLEGGRGGDGEADEENVCLRIGEGSQAVVVFLSGGVEEAEGVRFIADPEAFLVRGRVRGPSRSVLLLTLLSRRSCRRPSVRTPRGICWWCS